MLANPHERFDAAKYTLRAMLTLPQRIRRVIFGEAGPTDTVQAWSLGYRHTINDTQMTWLLDTDEGGYLTITRTVEFPGPNGPVKHSVKVHDGLDLAYMSPSALSKLIAVEIIGRETIPMGSRKEAREVYTTGERDAAYVFRTGVHHLLNTPLDRGTWGQLDMEDRWGVIHAAAENAVGHALGDHKPTWKAAGVSFDSHDMYYDGFNTLAGELLGVITPITPEEES